jgi:hypothetical protein
MHFPLKGPPLTRPFQFAADSFVPPPVVSLDLIADPVENQSVATFFEGDTALR